MSGTHVTSTDVPSEQAPEEPLGRHPEPADYRWFAPLNRSNLTAVLAGGVIAPHKSYADYEDDIQQFAGDGVLLVRGGVSLELLEAGGLEEGAANMMLAEIRIDDFPECRVRGLNEKGEVCETTLEERNKNIYVLTFPATIPATRIVAIHFKSEREKKNYMVRGFDNAPLDVVPMEVSTQLFQQDVPAGVYR